MIEHGSSPLSPFTPNELRDPNVFCNNGNLPSESEQWNILGSRILATMYAFYTNTVLSDPKVFFGEFLRKPVDPLQYVLQYGVCPNFGTRIWYPPADSNCGFILTTPEAQHQVELDRRMQFIRSGAFVSFDILNPEKVQRVKNRAPKIKFQKSDLGSVYINQLQQGRLFDNTRKGTCNDQYKNWTHFYEGIKWEKLLLMTVVRWAKFVGFTTVMVEPGWVNKWVKPYLPQEMKRFKIRYDVTARRCGFTQSSPNDPFRMQI